MAGLRRHPGGGYARGDETRARIIRSALTLFGERGFDGVSTRDIAALAGVPAPSLQYYFQNKDGLYAACIEDIQTSAMNAIGPALETVEGLLRSKANATRLIDAYCSVLDGLADFLFASPDAASRALFIARRRLSETAATRLDARMGPGSRIHHCCSMVIAQITRRCPTEEAVQLIAATINGQLLTLHFARDHLKALVGYEDITPARLEEMKRVVREQTTLLLKAYVRKAA